MLMARKAWRDPGEGGRGGCKLPAMKVTREAVRPPRTSQHHLPGSHGFVVVVAVTLARSVCLFMQLLFSVHPPPPSLLVRCLFLPPSLPPSYHLRPPSSPPLVRRVGQKKLLLLLWLLLCECGRDLLLEEPQHVQRQLARHHHRPDEDTIPAIHAYHPAADQAHDQHSITIRSAQGRRQARIRGARVTGVWWSSLLPTCPVPV